MLPFRQLAFSIVRGIPNKDFRGEVEAVQKWVRKNIRYTRDINGVETVATPDKTLEFGQGDCDDQSVLVATLLESIGFPTRFKAIGLSPGFYSHVFPEAEINGQWVSVETTLNVPLGWQPKDARSEMIVKN